MNCVEAKLRLEPMVGGTLEGEEKSALEEHLSLCEGCRLELELRQAIQSTPSLAPQLDFGDQAAGGAESPAAVASTTASPESAATGTEGTIDTAFTADTVAGDEMAPKPEAPITSGSAMTQDEVGEISFADLALDMPTLMTDSAQTTASSPPPPPPPPAKSTPAEEAAAPASNSWEFEPIDVPHDSAPPEGSLNFAHKALERKREDELKGKNAMIRIVLWGVGGLAGLALLGVSIWVALAVRQEPRDPTPAVRASALEPEAGSAPSDSTGTIQVGAGDDAGVAPAPAATAGDQANAAPPGPGSQDQPASSAPPVRADHSGASSAGSSPATSAGSDVSSRIQAGGLSAGSMPPLPIAPKASAPKPAAPKPAPAKASTAPSKRVTSATSKPAPGTTPHVAEQHSGGTSSTSSPSDSRATTPADGHDAAPGDQDGSSASKTEPSPDVRSEPIWSLDETPVEKTPTSPSPAPAARTTPRVAAPEASSSAPPAVPAPSVPPVPRPIDRLHLATQTAAAAGDLATLRKLKSTWKNFIRSGAGQDRARAKREFADCLWAIQEVTTRQSDQREALAAYREYVLSAPAGGTDARTVARMRYLEDVLSDIK